MAVPTMYAQLLRAWEEAAPRDRKVWSSAAGRLRLMVSGSAALPRRVFARWEQVGGQQILERYGMTEFGMALSNPLEGERRPGAVGRPLPGVSVRLVDEQDQPIEAEGVAGELQVKGPNVCLEYWGQPAATAAAFCGAWFRTGDIAVRERGYYRILGRQSVDIIKAGGYKVSALEVEEVLRTHPRIGECAIVGVEDAEWGERVCAAVVPCGASSLSVNAVRSWAKGHLAAYKAPTRLLLLDALPRNVMGKVDKPALKRRMQDESAPGDEMRVA